MKLQLLALDLDGTMLDRHSRLTDENRVAVARAQRAGVEVVLVTGRSWRGAKPYYEALGLTGPAICYLGALVVDGPAGRVLSHRPLTSGAWDAVRGLALNEGLPVTACVGADQAVSEGALPQRPLVAADTAFATGRAADFANWEDWNPHTQVTPDLGPCQLPPTMVAVYGEDAVRRFMQAFPNGLPDTQFDLHDKVAGETVLHVWHAQVDKGRALAAHCAAGSIPPERVMAIGDMPMDVSMIQFAGIGVAVPDAHPRLRAQAMWVASPAEAIDRALRS